MQITEVSSVEEAVYELLYEADPSREIVARILDRGHTFTAQENSGTAVVGVYNLLETRPFVLELMNISVIKNRQKQGLGKVLLQHSIKTAREMGAKTMEVATGNSSLYQIGFYQKAGFRLHSIEKDYFTNNYPKEIIENEIQCRDLLRMNMEL